MAIKQKNLYWSTDYEFQQLVDAGEIGLIKGIKTYDKNKKYKISTYLFKCICNEIFHFIQLNNLQKRKNPYGRDISLNAKVKTDGIDESETQFIDYIPGNTNIELEVEKKIISEHLVYAINHLKNSKDSLILKMYYGLDGYEELGTYEKVANKLGISRQCVDQYLHRGIRNLKKEMRFYAEDYN